MGGRGSTSSTRARQPMYTLPLYGSRGAGGGGGLGQNQSVNNVQNQAPSASNTPVNAGGAGSLAKMSDDQLAQLAQNAKSVQMPNHLNDVDDLNQKFVFQAGLNAKPTVLNQSDFDTYMQQNGISKGEIMSRSVGGANYSVNGTRISLSSDQVSQMTMYSDLNYVGGKHGGMAYGAGTYFDMNGGGATGYGSGKVTTMTAVLNPKTANVISRSGLKRKARNFERTHPKFKSQVGSYSESFSSNNMAVYALAMGYNVIGSKGGYNNVIDRSALVMLDRSL